MSDRALIICLAALVVASITYILWPKNTKEPSKREVELEERNKYLESENYKDSLYRIDTVYKRVVTTNERIIYNTKIYEKIIHAHDTTDATQHERYYANRYRQDSAINQR